MLFSRDHAGMPRWRTLALGTIVLLGAACASDPNQEKPQPRGSDYRTDQSGSSYHESTPAFMPDLPGEHH
jgi:hypothetical protein